MGEREFSDEDKFDSWPPTPTETKVVHFAWLLTSKAFCGQELAPDDLCCPPTVVAIPEGTELCEACKAAPEPPEPRYTFEPDSLASWVLLWL